MSNHQDWCTSVYVSQMFLILKYHSIEPTFFKIKVYMYNGMAAQFKLISRLKNKILRLTLWIFYNKELFIFSI